MAIEAWGAVVTAVAVLAVGYAFWRPRELPVPEIEHVNPPQARPEWKGAMRPDPSPPVVANGKVHCIDPATGYVIDVLEADTPLTIHAKITAAVNAQHTFRSSTWVERRQFLHTLRAWVMRDMEILARIACRDTGKTVRASSHPGHRRSFWRAADHLCETQLDAGEWRTHSPPRDARRKFAARAQALHGDS